jgi:outer membrane protein OmpA-like peptidoglycan-associated protein
MNDGSYSSAIAHRTIQASLLLLAITVFSKSLFAGVSSDIFIVLSEDAHSYVFKQTIRSSQKRYIFKLPKTLKDVSRTFIESDNGHWQHHNDNTLHFSSGNLSVMYGHKFNKTFLSENNGIFTYKNTREGEQGFTTELGFDQFTFTWVVPHSLQIEHYTSNIDDSTWQHFENILQFKTKNQNDIQVEIKFRQKSPLTLPAPEVLDKNVSSKSTSPSKSQALDKPLPNPVPRAQHTIKQDCNSQDNKHVVALLVCKKSNTVILNAIDFSRNSASLSPAVRTYLDALVKPLSKHPQHRFIITAYTDSKGPKKWNKKLSAERAHTVRLYLIYQGIEASQLIAAGMGEADPIASNASAEGRKKNRRLTLTLSE